MASQTMAEQRIGSLLVLKAGEMAGIVTETDMVRKVIAARLPASSISAGAVTNDPLVQIDIIRTVFMTDCREIARTRASRETYLVSRMQRYRHTLSVLRFTFHEGRFTRKSSESVIAAETFMNIAG
jgi:CBS domain-containing protein